MKKRMLVKAVMVAGFMLVAARAGSAQDAAESDHEALRKLRDVFQEAAARNDMDLMKPYLAPEFSIVTFTDKEFTDFETFKAQWQATRKAMLGQSGSYKVELDPERSLIMGDFALCRGNSRNVMVNDSGRKFVFTAHWTVICRKIDGNWKIVRGHNSLDPFRNPMLTYGVKKIVIQTGVIAFLVGLGLGVGGMLLKRRR